MNKKLLKFFINLNPNKKKRAILRNKYLGQEFPQSETGEYNELMYRNHANYKYIYADQEGEDLIYNELCLDKPSLICRFGSLELDQLDQFITNNKDRIYNFTNKNMIYNNAGFFPITDKAISRFASEMLDIVPNIDILGISYLEAEFKIMEKFAKNYKLTTCESIELNNVQSNNPWTKYLKDKNVLIIHPFIETMKSQYEKRKYLFKNENILPDCNLKFIKAVQSIADEKSQLPFKTWFEALDYMKSEIDKIDFDIAIIGCGAYGMFLADYCKRLGKKAVHMGGATQLLFGIKGKRYDNLGIYNEYWVRPSENEKPKGLEKVEGGCYW